MRYYCEECDDFHATLAERAACAGKQDRIAALESRLAEVERGRDEARASVTPIALHNLTDTQRRELNAGLMRLGSSRTVMQDGLAGYQELQGKWVAALERAEKAEAELADAEVAAFKRGQESGRKLAEMWQAERDALRKALQGIVDAQARGTMCLGCLTPYGIHGDPDCDVLLAEQALAATDPSQKL